MRIEFGQFELDAVKPERKRHDNKFERALGVLLESNVIDGWERSAETFGYFIWAAGRDMNWQVTADQLKKGNRNKTTREWSREIKKKIKKLV